MDKMHRQRDQRRLRLEYRRRPLGFPNEKMTCRHNLAWKQYDLHFPPV